MTEATFEKRLEALEARLNEAGERSAKREGDEYKKLARLLQEQVERLKRGLLGQNSAVVPAVTAATPRSMLLTSRDDAARVSK